MRSKEMSEMGFPDYYVYANGMIRKPNGDTIEKPYASGQVALYDEAGNKVFVPLAKLVATAFIPNEHNAKHVKHLNGNKSDCSAANLEWRVSRPRLTYKDLHLIESDVRLEYAKGKKPSRIAADLGAPLSAVKAIIQAFEQEISNAP